MKDKIFEISVDKLVNGGDGFARLPSGKAVFVDGVYPNEIVRIKIIQEKKDFARASLLEILTPSVHRITPFCPYFGKCGGCQWQNLDYEEQCHQKRFLFNELSQKAKISLPAPPVFFPSPKITETRHRFHFHARQNHIGFLARKSSHFIPVKDCPIAASPIRRFISSYDQYPPAQSFHVFANDNEYFVEYQSPQCRVSVLDKKFIFSPDLFFQNHLSLLEKMIPLILPKQSGEAALDLYAGVGLFSAFLENYYKKVFACESNKSATPFFAVNAPKSRLFSMDINQFIKQNLPQKIDFVVADPPRAGLSSDLIKFFLTKLPKKIAYISCNPVTQMRDLQQLCEKYFIESAYIFDFYLHTAHMETLICLQLK